jgi:hypothetical protein
VVNGTRKRRENFKKEERREIEKWEQRIKYMQKGGKAKRVK